MMYDDNKIFRRGTGAVGNGSALCRPALLPVACLEVRFKIYHWLCEWICAFFYPIILTKVANQVRLPEPGWKKGPGAAEPGREHRCQGTCEGVKLRNCQGAQLNWGVIKGLNWGVTWLKDSDGSLPQSSDGQSSWNEQWLGGQPKKSI